MSSSFDDLVSAVRTFLISEVSFTESGLNAFLEACETVSVQVLECRVRLHRELLQAREKLRVPKDKDLTDFDRRTMNEAYCAEVQEQYELMKGLEELVREKASLIKTIGEL